ncbi:hypothetical protein AAF712_010055 [Marasmius tenuissimus]|uniref:Uncharacterized protein n=1 Tax=Marasmius tenuissimus TaxID=585030 RepID=A0ABR2ZMZ3_9AGAR
MSGMGGMGGMGNMNNMGGPLGMVPLSTLDAEISAIPRERVLEVKREAGVEGKDNLSLEDKRRVVSVYRARQAKHGGAPPLSGPPGGMGVSGGPVMGIPPNSANPQGGLGGEPGSPNSLAWEIGSALNGIAEGSAGSSPPQRKTTSAFTNGHPTVAYAGCAELTILNNLKALSNLACNLV